MADRFISPEPLPTPYEDELLKITIEECTEVIQRATKMQRFGVKEIEPGQPWTNGQRLGMEIGNLFEMIDHLVANKMVTWMEIAEGRKIKELKLAKYMQHQKEDK